MHNDRLVSFSQEVANLTLHDDAMNSASLCNSDAPPASRIKNKGVRAMDITEDFKSAAEKLDVGQLIKDPFFTLFESVGALEIMDSKMDSGYLEHGETMEYAYDFSQALLPEEVIGIIDQLLCHEMAWHMGHPLAQTIFTSLYIDRLLTPYPATLDQAFFDRTKGCAEEEPLPLQILRAYCLGLIKTCGYVNNRVKSEHYYEEEDFVTHTFSRSLLDNIDTDSIQTSLEATTTLLSESTAILPEIQHALKFRLIFRMKVLKIVKEADSRDSRDVKTLWMDLLDLVPKIKSSISFGKPMPASFSAKIQRKLASTVPPRPIVQVSPEAAFAHLERLCRDGFAVLDVLDYYDSNSLMTFVFLFQARRPQPSVYIRTLLQHYLFGDMMILGKMSIRQVLDDDLSSSVLPAHKLLDRENDEVELPKDPRFSMASRMEVFRSRAASSYLDILRTFCQNRCRIRRTLCHTITDWDNLQFDSEELDQELQKVTGEKPVRDLDLSLDPVYEFPLSSWTYLFKLRQMEWLVQMGFELETYQHDELATMYWYLQYLGKTRSRHLERVRGFVIRNYADSRGKSDITAKSKKEYAHAISFINFSMMESAAVFGFADTLACLFTVLHRLKLIRPPPRPYSNDYLRYEVRMKPFTSIGLPELISFDELTRLATQPEEESLDLLKFAADSATGAKKGLELLSKLSAKDAFCQGSHDSWLQNTKNCLKACIFAGIAVAAVRKAIEAAGKDGQVKIKIDIPATGKGYHDWWVVPKVMPGS